MVRRHSERGIPSTRKPTRTHPEYGDRNELFLFKQERTTYFNQLVLFLIRHNKFAVIDGKTKKSNQCRKLFYDVAMTHVVGGENDRKFPVEVFTGKIHSVNDEQLWEPATFTDLNQDKVILITDGKSSFIHNILCVTVLLSPSPYIHFHTSDKKMDFNPKYMRLSGRWYRQRSSEDGVGEGCFPVSMKEIDEVFWNHNSKIKVHTTLSLSLTHLQDR